MSDSTRPSDNVIHVAFGGARRGQRRDAAAAARPPVAPPPPPTTTTDGAAERGERGADPVAGVYTREEVARLFGLTTRRLRSWERAGIARPSAEEGGAPRYTFQDLVAVRTAAELVAGGVPPGRIRRALEALRKSLPRATPLAELRIVSDGTTVAVRDGNTTYDPVTGQLLLDFSVGALRDDVVRVLPRRTPSAAARTAYDHFLDGCRLDGDPAARPRAEAAYRKAIELDPTLAGAYTNLGTLRLIAGDRAEAEALFRRAMMIDPSQSEAPYNLGFLRLEAGDHAAATELLERALALDPEFADAHFNLAIALEESGRAREATPHWAAYLALEPEGPYAQTAKSRLRDEG